MKCKLSECKYYLPNCKYGDICTIGTGYIELGVNRNYKCIAKYILDDDEKHIEDLTETLCKKREYVLKMSSK